MIKGQVIVRQVVKSEVIHGHYLFITPLLRGQLPIYLEWLLVFLIVLYISVRCLLIF